MEIELAKGIRKVESRRGGAGGVMKRAQHNGLGPETRGNVEVRLRKLNAKDAIVLISAHVSCHRLQMPVAMPRLVQGHKDSEPRQAEGPHIHVVPPNLNPGPEGRRDKKGEEEGIGWCAGRPRIGQEDEQDTARMLAQGLPQRQERALDLNTPPKRDFGETQAVEDHQECEERGQIAMPAHGNKVGQPRENQGGLS